MELRLAGPKDRFMLFEYLQELSDETRKRFGPHPFDQEVVNSICSQSYRACLPYICVDGQVVASYIIVQPGYIKGDYDRYLNYSVAMDNERDYTLAPSVADRYQSQGIGSRMYTFVEEDLKKRGVQKIILWGGVQASNHRAVHYYLKHGFEKVGEFEHHGKNFDMLKYLHS